jgi:hypothetical protein
MIHEIQHILGICGEKHLSILSVMIDWQNFSPIFNYIKTLLK